MEGMSLLTLKVSDSFSWFSEWDLQCKNAGIYTNYTI